MKKFFLSALCAVAMFAMSGCSMFYSDVSNVTIQFGWADGTSQDGFNGLTCIGSMWVYVDAFQTTFEPVAESHNWTTAGGTLYTKPMESYLANNYVKKRAEKAIALAKTNCKSQGYELPVGETFRVVYSYGAAKTKTKILNYEVK